MSRITAISALLLALCSSSCVTSVADGPVQQYSDQYAQATTVCMVRFPDRENSYPGPCADGDTLVATGFTVEPIKGECEGALISLHRFRQTWGCVRNYRAHWGEHDGDPLE